MAIVERINLFTNVHKYLSVHVYSRKKNKVLEYLTRGYKTGNVRIFRLSLIPLRESEVSVKISSVLCDILTESFNESSGKDHSEKSRNKQMCLI